MYLVGGGIEADLPVVYQQLIEQIFLTAAGLARAGAFQRVGDTVELDAQGQNVKNIAAGGFDLALSPAGADGFLRDAVVAAALLAPDSIAACLHAVAVRIGGDLQAQPLVDQTDGGEHPVIALELEHIVRTGQDRQQCEGGRGRKPFVVAGQAAEAFVNIQNPAQDCAVAVLICCVPKDEQRRLAAAGLARLFQNIRGDQQLAQIVQPGGGTNHIHVCIRQPVWVGLFQQAAQQRARDGSHAGHMRAALAAAGLNGVFQDRQQDLIAVTPPRKSIVDVVHQLLFLRGAGSRS